MGWLRRVPSPGAGSFEVGTQSCIITINNIDPNLEESMINIHGTTNPQRTYSQYLEASRIVPENNRVWVRVGCDPISDFLCAAVRISALPVTGLVTLGINVILGPVKYLSDKTSRPRTVAPLLQLRGIKPK